MIRVVIGYTELMVGDNILNKKNIKNSDIHKVISLGEILGHKFGRKHFFFSSRNQISDKMLHLIRNLGKLEKFAYNKYTFSKNGTDEQRCEVYALISSASRKSNNRTPLPRDSAFWEMWLKSVGTFTFFILHDQKGKP